MKTLDDAERNLAEVTAALIAKAEEIGLPDSPRNLGVTDQAIRLLARAHVQLCDQVRALHDLVNLTDPADPVGVALTEVGLARRTIRPEAGPRLVLAPAQVKDLSPEQLLALYCRVMGDLPATFAKHETFVVRVWDGMDGCWTDCTSTVGRDEALRYWAERTDGGTHHVSYAEIDYYRIFPGDTRMLWDGSERREMHR